MRILISVFIAIALSACSGAGTLAPGLTARMDAPGARLDHAQAFNIINQLRATRGTAPLVADATLNTKAQTLAAKYATSGNRPKKPAEATAMRISAGYTSFAETFSGWRSTDADASALVAPAHKRVGLGVAYSANSTYGVHWILLLDDGTTATQ